MRNFTEDDIVRITSNYSNPIGKGAFGEVYGGVLDDEYDLVAVKKYIRGDLKKEFIYEVHIHSQINHKNVVKLIGYCIGENTLMMVTEYISKGNLDEILHNSGISIPLDIRLGIAIGCAEALSYMHLSVDNLVYHGDIKPANILLDTNFTAKVSDFGLSRLLAGGITQYTITARGSLDYMDPIHLQEGCLTAKSDVYSFGVVLLELIARRRVKQGDINLTGTFCKACKKKKWPKELFDAEIANNNDMKILEEVSKLATECLTMDIHKRPHIYDVTERLMMLRKVQKGGSKKTSWRFFQGTQRQKDYRHGIFKRNSGSSDILTELCNLRIFSKEELNEVTQNYSYALDVGLSPTVYKGMLEDNTLVAVKRSHAKNKRDEFENAAKLLSEITHKNIIKLVGCSLEADHAPILVYEYAAKGSLSDILHGKKDDLRLELRIKIAIKTAEALAHLHILESGVIQHGSVQLSNILLDDNFVPKVSGFYFSKRLTEDIDPISVQCGLLTVKRDVYYFGIISRKETYHESLLEML